MDLFQADVRKERGPVAYETRLGSFVCETGAVRFQRKRGDPQRQAVRRAPKTSVILAPLRGSLSN